MYDCKTFQKKIVQLIRDLHFHYVASKYEQNETAMRLP